MPVAAFPSIAPTSRVWVPGAQPINTFTALSGYEARVLLGPNAIGASLSLGFQNKVESVILQITDHFVLAQGSYDYFSLPIDLFAGMTNYTRIALTGYSWRYANAPSVEWVSPGIGNVSVSLLAIRP